MNHLDIESVKNNIEETYKVIEFNEGHYKTLGKYANCLKNPFWKVIDEKNEKNEEIILMYCEKNTICKLCLKSYQKILDFEKQLGVKITWTKGTNGYISGSNNLYIHQVIMDCYGNGKGTKTVSVDHIDRDQLNNCYDNLRIATFDEQHSNCKGIIDGTKRARKQSAKPLPDDITQDMLSKYVVYYHEWLNKEHTKYREFFKVEKHPKMSKIWIGTKSNGITIQDKLTQANKVVENLEKNIYPGGEVEPKLPKYVTIHHIRDKPHLVFDKRTKTETGNKRINLTMILPENYDLDVQLELFNEKVKEKYPDLCIYIT